MLHEFLGAMSQKVPHTASALVKEERALAVAFASFTEVAGSLERSYTQLQREVGRLRRELETANGDLVRSLDENRRSRQHLDQLLEVLPCGVLEVSGDGEVLLANPEAKRLCGDMASVPKPICALLDGCDRQGGELECAWDSDASRWMAIRRSTLGSQEQQRKIFILQDISRLKRLQQDHEKLRRKQALAELSAVLAHEVRNPLASMELFAGLLAGSELSNEQRECIEHLQSGLRTLGATVNNVLQFHSDAGPQFVQTDLGEFLRSLQEFLQPLVRQSDIQFELNHHLHGVSIPADRHRLQQVFLNLALNSIRQMPQGGRLEIGGELLALAEEQWAASTFPTLVRESSRNTSP